MAKTQAYIQNKTNNHIQNTYTQHVLRNSQQCKGIITDTISIPNEFTYFKNSTLIFGRHKTFKLV